MNFTIIGILGEGGILPRPQFKYLLTVDERNRKRHHPPLQGINNPNSIFYPYSRSTIVIYYCSLNGKVVTKYAVTEDSLTAYITAENTRFGAWHYNGDQGRRSSMLTSLGYYLLRYGSFKIKRGVLVQHKGVFCTNSVHGCVLQPDGCFGG